MFFFCVFPVLFLGYSGFSVFISCALFLVQALTLFLYIYRLGLILSKVSGTNCAFIGKD